MLDIWLKRENQSHVEHYYHRKTYLVGLLFIFVHKWTKIEKVNVAQIVLVYSMLCSENAQLNFRALSNG